MRWALPLLLVACSYDTAQWQPAVASKEYPAVKDAYRVKSADSMCERIGTVSIGEGEGGTHLQRLAETAARHGGTHYVVDDDHTDRSVTYNTTGTVVGNTYQGTTRPVVHENRVTSAIVYRCP